jgi:hypothetical protein
MNFDISMWRWSPPTTGQVFGILLEFCKYRFWGKKNRIYLQGSTRDLTARTSATTEEL